MGFFNRLFGNRHTRLEIADPELGKFDSDYVNGSDVTWLGSIKIFGISVELIISGNHEKLSVKQKDILLSALSDQLALKAECSEAIKQEYANADLDFTSIDEQFKPMAITTNNDGFELSFEQKDDPYYYFNVHFENNKPVGVSIDS